MGKMNLCYIENLSNLVFVQIIDYLISEIYYFTS